MSHDARSVANALIDWAAENQRPFTPMQIIKLVYICHGWMLGLHGRPLIFQPVEAWQYGPVISTVYQGVKQFGGSHVTGKIEARDGEFDEIESDLIEQVCDKYSRLSGIALSRLTHAQDTPWHTIWNMYGQNSIIPNDLIEDHYAEKARAAVAG